MADREELIQLYFNMGLTQKNIAITLAHSHAIFLSVRHLRRILKKCHLARRTYSDINETIEFIQKELQGSGMLHGYRWMWTKCQQNRINVRQEHVRIILSHLDPAGTAYRRTGRLQRRNYFAKGPNYIWHVDSYDKLKYFGICINGCMDGFSRKVVWVNAYITSSDPAIIGGYYMQAIKKCGKRPFLVRTDLGTENGHIHQLQQVMASNQVDAGENCFLTGCSKLNQRIEYWWGFLRKECAEFWIQLFHEELKHKGDFDGLFLNKNVLQFTFMGFIQDDLDAIAEVWNAHHIRQSRNLRSPSGHPNIMYFIPHLYGTEEKGCAVDENDIVVCEEQCKKRICMPCQDEDVFHICCALMSENNLQYPKDAYDGIELYKELRRLLLQEL